MLDLEIMEGPINYTALLQGMDDPTHGARNIFLGVVRNHNHGREVLYLDYEVHEKLALKTMKAICEEAKQKWGTDISIRFHHSKGRVEIGEASVGIVVSTKHRDESYESSRYVIEELKKRVPIWKNEKYADGESGWLDGNSLCRCDGIQKRGAEKQ